MKEPGTTGGRPTGGRAPTIVVVAVVTASLYFARDVLIPLALGILVSFLLAPLVRWLERHRIDRRLCVPAVVLAVALLLAGVGTLLTSQLMTLLERVPEYAEGIRSRLLTINGHSRLFERLSQAGHLFDIPLGGENQATRPIPVSIEENAHDQFAFLQSVLSPMLSPLSTLGLVIVFVFFMLLKWDDLRDRLLRLSGQGHINVTTQALEEASARVSRYLQMQLLINTLVGLLIGAGLAWLGVPNAALWGMLVALMRFVPYVGPWVAAAGPLLVIAATTEGYRTLLAGTGLFLVVELFAVNLLEPWLYGLRTGLSAIGVLISFVFWGWLWGPVGLILATPLSVCLLVAAHHLPQLESVEVLLSDQRALPSSARLYHRLLALDADEGEQIVEDELSTQPSLAGFYDRLLLPVMAMAERDRHSESLSEERRRAVYNSLQAFVGRTTKASGGAAKPVVLCLPADDLADHISANMAARVLMERGIFAEALSHEAEPSDIVERVSDSKPTAIVVSAVPPMATVYAQELCRTLHERFPRTPIIVGLWKAEPLATSGVQRLKGAGASAVVHFMEDLASTLHKFVDPLRPNTDLVLEPSSRVSVESAPGALP